MHEKRTVLYRVFKILFSIFHRINIQVFGDLSQEKYPKYGGKVLLSNSGIKYQNL